MKSSACNIASLRHVRGLRLQGVNLPRLGVDLLELQLVRSDDFTTDIEDQEPRRGGSLVNGADKGCGRHDVNDGGVEKRRRGAVSLRQSAK